MNGKSWFGPAVVLAQQGQSVWVHTIRDIKKGATCRVKPFQLVDRESIKDSNSNEMILEDFLNASQDFKHVDKYTRIVNGVEEKDVPKWVWSDTRNPSPIQRRKLVALMLMSVIEIILINHIYLFDNKVYRQAIG